MLALAKKNEAKSRNVTIYMPMYLKSNAMLTSLTFLKSSTHFLKKW